MVNWLSPATTSTPSLQVRGHLLPWRPVWRGEEKVQWLGGSVRAPLKPPGSRNPACMLLLGI